MLSKEEKDRMVVENMRLVYYAANKKFSVPRDIYDDIVQEGMIGLVKAVNDYEKFDPSRGNFATFALAYIRQEMSRALWKAKNKSGLSASWRVVRDQIKDDTEIGRLLSSAAASCESREGIGAQKTGESGDGSTLIDLVASTEDEYDIFKPDEKARLSAVMEALSLLPEREHTVIVKMYGIGCEPMTQQQIGKEMGCCAARISQIHRMAINRLRHPDISEGMKDFL